MDTDRTKQLVKAIHVTGKLRYKLTYDGIAKLLGGTGFASWNNGEQLRRYGGGFDDMTPYNRFRLAERAQQCGLDCEIVREEIFYNEPGGITVSSPLERGKKVTERRKAQRAALEEVRSAIQKLFHAGMPRDKAKRRILEIINSERTPAEKHLLEMERTDWEASKPS